MAKERPDTAELKRMLIKITPQPKNWKIMSRKDKDKWIVERVEQWREEQENAKYAALAGAKEKRAQLARARSDLMAKDLEEQEVRRGILRRTCALYKNYEQQMQDFENNKQMEAEWMQYLQCDGLPDPRVVTQLNTYLHRWKEKGIFDVKELDQKCLEVLPMLEMLEEMVSNARLYSEQQVKNYIEIRSSLRTQLSHAIEFASYSLLCDIEHNLNLETIRLLTYERQFKGLKLTLWCTVKLPARMPKAVEAETEPTELSFPTLDVTVKLPNIIDTSAMCVRASKSMMDLLSETSNSYKLVAEMPNRDEDLYTFNVKEMNQVQKLKNEQDKIRSDFYKALKERTNELEATLKANVYAKLDKEKEELEELYLREPPSLPDPRGFVAEENEKAFKEYLKQCDVKTQDGELNLRKYRICGGILNLDLLRTPPQPKKTKLQLQITTMSLPKQLKSTDYRVQYRAPDAPPPGVVRTPEEIEAEMKRIEAEYERLALVTINLPQDTMWTDPPVICQWHERLQIWTSDFINDYKFNEDKLILQFRTGILWPIGIGTLRHSNLPFQGWDIKPCPKSQGVLVVVTGVCVTVTLLCDSGYVKIKKIANAATPALKEHMDKRYSLKKLIQIMREASCDLFPDFDGHNHVEGSCPKQWASERHLYHTMAFLSRAYNFQWSRWNSSAGWRNIVIQLREAVDTKREVLCALSFFATGSYQSIVGVARHLAQRTVSRCLRQVVDALNHRTRTSRWIKFPRNREERSFIQQKIQREFGLPGVIGCIDCTHVALVKPSELEHQFYNRKGYHSVNVQMGNLQSLYVTPQRCYVLKCNEMSQEFDTEPMEGMTFFPDLFALNLSYGSIDARRQSFNLNFKMVETLFNLLQELKLCSYS